ncbi:MAG: hypothetical protein CM1200mP41_22150 [Gammaproteobacteria bacterium]|nr:MAG: hypothetical protein CM1200mP41_22150 [Gammaproteobacteria bacterium]
MNGARHRICPTVRFRIVRAGELVGGLFFENYPGGSGLTAGTVFGKLAGETLQPMPCLTQRDILARASACKQIPGQCKDL